MTNTAYNLTERETEVVGLICEGMSRREVSVELSTSLSSLDRDMCSILRKMGAQNTAHAAYLWGKASV